MQPDAERAAHSIAAGWETAWNSHDMSLMASLLTEDVDFVNVLGSHWKGRAQVESVHAAMHKTQFHASTWQNRSVAVQTIQPDVALVHVEWSVAGDFDPDGAPRQPRTGVFSWLLVLDQSRWLIRSAHNTNVTVLRRA